MSALMLVVERDRLRLENKRLKDHIKRLMDAGNAVELDKQALRCVMRDLGVAGTLGNASTQAWRKAKEAKL